jgi:biofilm PGA synthesis N-glycosyltransferase PgaC
MLIFIAIFIIYFLLLVAFLVGWKRAVQPDTEEVSSTGGFISVIIPVRNEEMSIGNLLEDLSRQDYKKFEIIVVNDHSEDETLWVVNHFEGKNVKVIDSKGRGKKAAITSGVAVAKGSVIVTTDADCSVPSAWLSHISSQFRHPNVKMIFGGVRMQGDKSFFGSLQEIEFSSLIGSGASTAALGFPTICNGANLAFLKEAFFEVKGYEGNFHIASGDDEFLMRKIEERFPRSIRFLSSPAAAVSTKAEPDLENFLNQRIRWASKWRYNSSVFSSTLAVFVLVLQLTILVNWYFLLTPQVLQSLFLIVVKMILEAAFLLQVSRFLQVKWNWLAFFSLQFIYPVYVIVIAAASFFRSFQWKNRIFKP